MSCLLSGSLAQLPEAGWITLVQSTANASSVVADTVAAAYCIPCWTWGVAQRDHLPPFLVSTNRVFPIPKVTDSHCPKGSLFLGP